jgi:hypothetical protein
MFVGMLVPVLALVPAAQACDTTTHCYGIAQWAPAPNNGGAKNTINTSCLRTPNTSDFITIEEWVVGGSGGGSWIEEGIAYGDPRSDRYWYWADNRPGHPYAEHDRPDLPSALNTDYVAMIKQDVPGSSSTWNVSQDGTQIGQSVDNFSTPSNILQAGSETTVGGAKTSSDAKALHWYALANGWTASWENNFTHAILITDSGYSASWSSQYSHADITRNLSSC